MNTPQPDNPISRGGFIMVQKIDLALLNERFMEASVTVKAVWLALLTLANQYGDTFKVPRSTIRQLACVSASTVKRAIQRLVEVNLLRVESERIPGTKENDFNTYTIVRRSVHKEPRSVQHEGHSVNRIYKDQRNIKNGESATRARGNSLAEALS